MKKVFVILTMILLAQLSFAQAVPALLVPSDSRSLAMGGVALQPEVSTLDVRAFYGMWSPKRADNTIFGGNAYLNIGSKLGFSVEAKAFLDHTYSITSAQGIVIGKFRPIDKIAGVGVSYRLSDAFTAGLKGRIVSSSIAEDAKGTAFCVDASFTYNNDLLTATVALRNLGPKIKYGKSTYSLPALVALQGSIKPIDGLTVAAEFDCLFSGALMAGLGVEYGIADIAFLRAGLHYGDKAKAIPTYASLGLGVQFAGVHLDAAFLAGPSTLRNSLLISLGYAF